MNQSSPVNVVADKERRTASASWRAGAADCAQALLALLCLPVIVLPLAFTALAVFLTLGRPVLFRQTRIGRDGRTFEVIKLRTMTDARDDEGGLLPDEGRLTPVTRLIRRLRFDELMQTFNVVAGDMAIVGPRPLTPATIAAFGAPGSVRCQVRPGLTGWAQVNGNTRLTDRDKLALDVWYVDHRSVGLDLLIICLTVVTILGGERLRPRAVARARHHLENRHA